MANSSNAGKGCSFINVNGLNKKNLKESDSKIQWYELDKWMDEQEKYFAKNNITDDDKKIRHIILHIDVRFWTKLENFYKFNQRDVVEYEKLKSVLLKKVQKKLDPQIAKKYDSKVDGLCDKLNITNLNLENLKTWLKKLRHLCDGQATDDYLTIKILNRIVNEKKEETLSNLLLEIKQSIELYESRMVDKVGKEKKKELSSLKTIKETIKDMLNYS